jgi:16S rRNA (guanine527-N7)-methyltransferase
MSSANDAEDVPAKRPPPAGADPALASDVEASAAAAAEEALAGNPETPVPSLDAMRAALDWAFQGEEIVPALLDAYARHALLLLEGNRELNLTAIVDPREVAAKHYLDCWRITRLVPLFGRSVCDVGSGAGFPGMPVAMAEPETRVVLLDSTKKRVDFMTRTIAALGLKNVSAVWDRAEEHLARNDYDVVLMRAVSSVRENVRTLRKVRHSHKDLVMLKGPSWSREVRAGEREAERLGFRLDTVWEHTLPEGMGERAILVYRAPGAQGS